MTIIKEIEKPWSSPLAGFIYPAFPGKVLV
jgi:hypothetical protein